MCGIAGIVNKRDKNVNESELIKMLDVIAHRGPDGFGTYMYNTLGLGHRRLSILDISHAGDQPMHWKDSLSITYNGEIYNYIEIREELTTLGYEFHTNCDTEVLLAAYDCWGEKCVNKFNGMWAFAILDKNQNKLFCSRDRFGVKPFYYYQNDDQFIFASEIKQILEIEPINSVNQKILLQYLAINMTEHSNETFFENVLKLRGSHNLIYDLANNKFSIYRYYDIKQNTEIGNLSLQESIELFEAEFARSINWRLRSDVKVGTCLSGGLDSSYIAAISSKQYYQESNEKFIAITVGSVEKETDETKYAECVVKHLDMAWHLTIPSAPDFLNAFDAVIWSHEEPFSTPSVFMQNFVMKEANKAGIKVLLDGQGADEVLLGYTRYIASQLKAIPFYKIFSFLLNSKKNYGISMIEVLKNYFYFSSFNIRRSRIKSRVNSLKKEYLDLIDFSVIKNLSASYNNLFELQKNEIFTTQIPQLLKWEDKNSMAFSIETRLPFLDYKLVECCLSINSNFKIVDGWSKYLLRKNMEKVLPDDITWRKKKVGFTAPVDKWLPERSENLKVINSSKIINKLYSSKITDVADRNLEWRLYNIAVWEKKFNMVLN